MIADPHCYVVVDCSRPSYVSSDRRLVVLSNHILNDHLKRKQHPMYNATTGEEDAYTCDKSENVWRVNPSVFGGTSGFIGSVDVCHHTHPELINIFKFKTLKI